MDALTKASVTEEAGFAEVVGLITDAQQRAFQAVNTTLIDLYWQVGEYISRKIEAAEWGDGIVPQLAQYIARTQPGLRGFTPRNLFRMKQFYDSYRGDSIVSALRSQLSWTHHRIILGQSNGLKSASSTCGWPYKKSGQAASWSGSSTSLSLSTLYSPL
jgi:hypothetical protein